MEKKEFADKIRKAANELADLCSEAQELGLDVDVSIREISSYELDVEEVVLRYEANVSITETTEY